MWLEIGTFILSSMLSLVGVGVSQLNAEVAKFTPAPSCERFDAESCLSNEACDVFIADGGSEMCGLACDLRTVADCAADGACRVVDGVCDYADHSPVGC